MDRLIEDKAESKALRYLLNSGLTRGWLSWLTLIEELNHSKEAMARSLGQMMHSSQARGFHAWIEMVESKLAFMAKLRKSAAFLKDRQLAVSWRSWRDFWREASGFWQRPEDPALRAMQFLLFRVVAQGWNAWKDFAHERSEFMRKLRRGVSIFTKKDLQGVWRCGGRGIASSQKRSLIR